MKPVHFSESNVVFAKDQPQHLQLPAYKTPDGTVITCWQMTFFERFKLLLAGKMWLTLLTFNTPLQPLKPSIDKPMDYIIKLEKTLAEITPEVKADNF